MGQPQAGGRRVVVIGAGISGLTSALRAAELGAAVTLLEQGADELYPCNTRFSGGIIHASFHDVNRPAPELFDIMKRAAGSAITDSIASAIAADGRRMLAWLQKQGVRFMSFSPQEAHKWCMAPPRPIGRGLDWKGRGPDATLRTLLKQFANAGGTIVFGARAQSLLMEDGRCAGVAGEAGGNKLEWRADATVIADGGYQSNTELFKRHIGPRPDRVLQRGAANGHGDGLLMAMKAGAATSDLGTFYGHLIGQEALTNPDLWPYPELDAIAVASIVVSANGERILDEGLGGISISNDLAKLDDPASTTAIFDAKVWDGPGKSARFAANPYFEKFGGTVFRAQSIEELAAQTGLPAMQLTATIRSYNDAVSAGTTADLSPRRSTKKAPAMPIETAPFMAIRLCAGITYTMGGIVIDGDGCVLRDDGSAISGLYAAGAAATGVEGRSESGVGYVGGLIRATLAMRAAEHAMSVSPAENVPA